MKINVKNILKPILLVGIAFSLYGASNVQKVSANSNNQVQTVTMQNISGNLNNNKARDTKVSDSNFNSMRRVAQKKLGDRYVYGAVGPHYFDCSGFTRYIYKYGSHITLPRTAQAQYNNYQHISRKERQKGDLVFFGNSKHSISHVGMYVGRGKMIDAQNRGVIVEHIHAPWWHEVGYSRPA